MTVHTYPRRAIAGDYARAGAGLGLTGVPLALSESPGIESYVLGGALILFSAFGWKTIVRHLTSIEVDERGIVHRAFERRFLPWRELADVRLRYYSTKRDRTGGWLLLRLTGGRDFRRRRLRIDSGLDGFDAVARLAAAAVRANGLALDAASAANFAKLGIAWHEPGPPAPAQ